MSEEAGERSAAPKSGQEAHARLYEILQQVSAIKEVGREDFVCGWNAIAYIAPSLAPDEAEMEDGGWPVAWVPVAVEACRRFKLKELTKEEFHASSVRS